MLFLKSKGKICDLNVLIAAFSHDVTIQVHKNIINYIPEDVNNT